MSNGRLVGVLSSVMLTGCLVLPGLAASSEHTFSRMAGSESAKPNDVVFVCAKDLVLTVAFAISDPTEPALVRASDGGHFSLPARQSGSGYRYADETHELRGKGREATWTDASKPPVLCTARTAAGRTEPK